MDVVEPERKEEEMKKETDIEALLLARLLLVTSCEEGIKVLRQVPGQARGRHSQWRGKSIERLDESAMARELQ
jgi:hypothetical protein